MRNVVKWGLRVVLALVVAAAVVGFIKREEITRLLAVNSLFTEEKIVSNFSNMNGAFLSAPVSRGNGAVSDLPKGPDATMPADLADWTDARHTTSLLVLKDGQIVYEDYLQGTGPDDRRISWSIAKSYLSALFGVLLEEGAVASLDDPVTRYAPQLTGSAYDGATIRNVLQMSSGVLFDEDYFDQKSDINRMGRVIALGGTLDDFTASFTERFTDPGSEWTYVSIDTHVIGMVIRGATGRSVAELLSEKIIAPLGLEQDGYYLTDGAGAAFVLGGLNFTTRDYARFGEMIRQNGLYGGTQVVPADWIAESTPPSANTKPEDMGYGFQWWSPTGAKECEFLGQGVYGQYQYNDQPSGVVLADTAADRKFRDKGVSDSNIEMMRRIARSL
ncbi:MAG: serine hydrolase domain-containing protein [Paracoccaceae bacterium]